MLLYVAMFRNIDGDHEIVGIYTSLEKATDAMRNHYSRWLFEMEEPNQPSVLTKQYDYWESPVLQNYGCWYYIQNYRLDEDENA